ncbi:MAG: hypothetical protein JO262_21420 [Solirubrobacterales bacterium]|nr:hypothetical protein [Solirubrobacterales bacterium]
MSALLIVIIVVAVILLIGLVFGAMRGRRAATQKREERRLVRRREEAAGEHRQVAEARTGAAAEAEHRARVAGAIAERERAEARLHEERARAHEMGLADDELMRDGRTERDTGAEGYERGAVTQEEAPIRRGDPDDGER